MSCSAATSISSELLRLAQISRFLALRRWRYHHFTQPLHLSILAQEQESGGYLFVVDATMISRTFEIAAE